MLISTPIQTKLHESEAAELYADRLLRLYRTKGRVTADDFVSLVFVECEWDWGRILEVVRDIHQHDIIWSCEHPSGFPCLVSISVAIGRGSTGDCIIGRNFSMAGLLKSTSAELAAG